MPYVAEEAIEYLRKHPETTGAELFRLGIAPSGRTARRWRKYFEDGSVGETVYEDHDDSAPRTRPTPRRVNLRAAVYDIETTDFGTESYAGYLICCCILPLDGDDVQVLKLNFEDYYDDRRLLVETIKALGQYEILIGHNIAAFDAGFLASRLMYHGLPPMRTHLVFDTYQVARSLAIKTRKGLGNLTDYFGLEGEKTTIYRSSWNKIRSPRRDEFQTALDEIVYHCKEDVIANRQLFDVLYPYAISTGANPFKLSKFRNVWAEV